MTRKQAKSPTPVKRERSMSPSMEQYIETIAHLLTKDKVCSVSDIAEEIQVSRPAASRAVRDLAEKNLVEHRAYGYVDLTPEGQTIADKLTARHEALFRFFHQVLGFDEEAADEEACRLEHEIEDGMAHRLGELTDWLASEDEARTRWFEWRG